ncbi:MAG: NAD-binding protein [Candidatus Thermoplasmatota archaeon]
MYVVIGGAGDAGLHLGKELIEEGHEVAFIEKKKDAADKARGLDAYIVEGNVCNHRYMIDADINDCDYYIGLTRDDSVNLLSASLANFYGCRTIARVKSPELSKNAISRRYLPVGVDLSLCPSLISSLQISRLFSFPSRLKNVKKTNIKTYHATVEEDSGCKNRKISSLDLPEGAIITSVFRGVKQIIPSDTFILQPEDEICLFLDQRVNKEEVEKEIGCNLKTYGETKNAFIAGITPLAETLAKKLIDSNISITMMDLSPKRTKEAAEEIPEASVINADPLGHGVLLKEGIEKFDILLATGRNLERNIFTSILSKQFNVSTAITLMDRIDLKESVEKTLVDDAIVPNLLMVKAILNIIRETKENPSRGFRRKKHFKTKTLETEDILVEEIKVKKKVRCLNKKIGSFSPDIADFLIAAVEKNGKGFIPNGEYVIKEGDKLFVLYHSSGYDTVKRWLIG